MDRRHATKPNHSIDLDRWFGNALLFIAGASFILLIDLLAGVN